MNTLRNVLLSLTVKTTVTAYSTCTTVSCLVFVWPTYRGYYTEGIPQAYTYYLSSNLSFTIFVFINFIW